VLAKNLLVAAVVIFLYMTIVSIVARRLRRNDLADVAWGLGFVVVTLSTMLYQGLFGVIQLTVAFMVTLWGVRLSSHIFGSWRKRAEEDYRYQAMRKSWKYSPTIQAYFQVFLLQGLLLFFVAMPIFVINSTKASFTGLIYAGLLVWIIGFILEATADNQLRKFLAQTKNKGNIMDKGLWKYSRHPNYFGEVTQWWGIGFIALTLPFGWLGLVGPITITFLIIKVSGIPLLEKRYAENLQYQAYAKKTSVFLPLPSKA